MLKGQVQSGDGCATGGHRLHQVLLYDQQKKLIITSRHCPAQLGPGEGFTGRRFIGWQGIYRRKRRSNLSGGEGSGVASNANVSVWTRESSGKEETFGVF